MNGNNGNNGIHIQGVNGHSTARHPTEAVDFAIIGSGFGGSVSAWRLTEKGYSVVVLERGKRFGPNDFPKKNWNVFRYLWMPALRCFGIQGLNFYKDMWLLNGSGVGGGSLVYASTHRQPPDSFYAAEEWCDLADWGTELKPFYDVANRMLGTATNPCLWPADHKLKAIAEELGQGHTFEHTPVGIYFGQPGVTVDDPYFGGLGPTRTGCIHCGGCMVGCRHNAKNTLDKNYLYLAERFGAQVWPESAVNVIRPLYGEQPDGARYEIEFVKVTDWFNKRQGSLRAKNVVVAAGVVGTVDLLLRCRDEHKTLPLLSRQVGMQVRSNTEALMGVTARHGREDYSKGVAISSHFWVDDVTSVEPCRYPPGSSFMRTLIWPLAAYKGGGLGQRVLESFKHAFRRPSDFVHTRLMPGWAERDTVLLIMQTTQTRMTFHRGRSLFTLGRKGLVTERDPDQPIPAVVEAGREVTERFAAKVDGVPWVGLNDLMDTPNTAHILGGCPMGIDDTSGVVDHKQRVFNYDGMYVADGSVVPACLGVNPSLTIAAMTERAMSLVPPKAEAPPPEPLVAPAGVTIDNRPINTAAVRAKQLAPLALVLGLFLSVFQLVLRSRTHTAALSGEAGPVEVVRLAEAAAEPDRSGQLARRATRLAPLALLAGIVLPSLLFVLRRR
jgi:cholesterol oxidase